ncbi:glycosyltransferase family A protein [Dankookia rubra]|uniref:glycosyltransferase family A protein n=1 Tax=Dankookia rubra TaxID=1442381 RepID=UPI001407C58E|nr:glycosyltransferase family A protein [Dankookia rubra]
MPAAASVAVFARNEAAGLQDCLRALGVALDGLDASITVVLNDTTDGSAGVVRLYAKSSPSPMRLFEIRFGDKSNAWNQYVHALAPAASMHVFVDGYAMVTPDAIRALAAALAEHPQAHAAAALPSCGRSAPSQRAAMRRSPALHGSLHALRGTFLDRIRAAGIYLPIGLYRGDGLVGSLVVHDLDARANAWDTGRIALAEAATWTVAPLSPFRPRDLRRLWNRRIQQARGGFEDAALKECIYSGNYGSLPRFADYMVADWLQRNPVALQGRSLFPRLARARLASPRAPAKALLEASMVPLGPVAEPPGPWRTGAEGASPPLSTGNPA